MRVALQDALAAAAPKGGLAAMAPSMKLSLVPCSEVRGARPASAAAGRSCSGCSGNYRLQAPSF